MMWEASRLQQWYGTPQGAIVSRHIGHIIDRWIQPGSPVDLAFGLGFLQPYWSSLDKSAHCVVGAAPAEMGVLSWPPFEDNRIAQTHPDALPFPDASFGRVFMIHMLESVDTPSAVLREIWRVLHPGGRLLIVVPNRTGLWSLRNGTPFSSGASFSPRQLRHHLQNALFLPRQYAFGLHTPPFNMVQKVCSTSTWEKIGARWFTPLGGVILCEAEKVMRIAPTLLKKQVPLRARLGFMMPATENRTRTNRTCGESPTPPTMKVEKRDFHGNFESHDEQ